MKVLALTRYSRSGASSRLRFLQYLPYLKSAEIQLEIFPLFSDSYVSNLQSGYRSTTEVISAYLKRIKSLRLASEFDLLWIEKDTLPWLPDQFELGFANGNTPMAIDYDDAVFHSYDQHRSYLVRKLLKDKHSELMRRSSLVIAGNEYLAKFARQAGAKRVEIVPTVVDINRYPPRIVNSQNTSELPLVGWIGQRATASFLLPLVSVFQQMVAKREARFAAIGIDTEAFELPMQSISWSEETEVESLSSFDIGIMPLVDEPFERGKCGYKLIQYMACGIPVVASPVGVNNQIVDHGVNGFLVDSPEEWLSALRILASDVKLRMRMGQAGRLKVAQHYCLQRTESKVVNLLMCAAGFKNNR